MRSQTDPDPTRDPHDDDYDEITADEREDGAEDDDDDDLTEAEPAPQPTAFGAGTVAGAVAASAVADPDRDGRTAQPTDRREDLDDGPVTADRDDHAVGVAAAPPGATVPPEEAGGPPVAMASDPDGPTGAMPSDPDGPPVAVPSDAGGPLAGGRPTPVETEPDTVRDEPEIESEPEPDRTPGAVPAAAVPSLWDDGAALALRERWRDVQLRFVDDPRAAADEAQALVGEAVDGLASALAQRRADLDGWRSGQSGDTEQLRVAVRGYREFLDRLLGL